MSNMILDEHYGIKDIGVVIIQVIGIMSIVLLIYLPNKISIVSLMVRSLDIETRKYYNINIEELICIVIFLFTYFVSLKKFNRYKSTKLFSLLTSFLMTVTLIALVIFKN